MTFLRWLAPGGQIFIIFTTNSGVTKPGWEAEYTTYPVSVEENDRCKDSHSILILQKNRLRQLSIILADGKGSIELMNLNGVSSALQGGRRAKGDQ